MNHRELVLAPLAGRQFDRVPWFGDMTHWASAQEERGFAPAGWPHTPVYHRFHRELGVGYYL